MNTIPLHTILKLMAHPERMAILIQLLDSERNIAELAKSLSLPATAVSGHLSRLRVEGLVDFTRYHRIIEYRLISEDAATILHTVRDLENKRVA
ncbi:ArsR family transcriptional regulator [Neisseria meningitidis]|uniref:ArsR/SmtB family transcription factor n=1 Tax=Neisseria meningitidis TaxID=487 RepID=UPI0012A9BE91|nr:ArsR family transcriptional regulator [Neisseria meningitidis]MBG8961874.1 ArsR family transcriptional regulator [Neisseria meningitidis]MBG9015269.1 ArsR family transcriptional regulator [Neisseria meningitidis]MBG9098042.1 ArsR family transcriptional regulator [Neisseria meningitidis]QGK45698.1 ArsR family transcriptional regulator [Neisseria meningitidis]QPH63418.1 ArsR family transcriptional regulator [Neisseria meningitidis]